MKDVWVDKHRLMINESDLQQDREHLLRLVQLFSQNRLTANETYPCSCVPILC